MRILLGYQRRQYTNKEGKQVIGYEIYFGNRIDQNGKGYSPALRYNPRKQQFQNWFISEKTFNSLKEIDKLVGKPVQIFTDPDYGNIASIIAE